MNAMTPREKTVFDFIVSYWTQHSRSPTYLEIGSGVGLRSTSTVHKYVSALVRKGMIQHAEGTMRALKPTHRTVESAARTSYATLDNTERGSS